MITPEEMRKLLFDEFGIRTDDELDKELEKLGGIRIGLFVDPKDDAKNETAALAV